MSAQSEDNRREWYTLNGDYIRISKLGTLQRCYMGNWVDVKASDYPNALLARLNQEFDEQGYGYGDDGR